MAAEIRFTLIASAGTSIDILAEYCNKKYINEDYSTIARSILNANTSRFGDDTRLSFCVNNNLFYLLAQNGILFLCLADRNFGKNMSFVFLNDLAKEYHSSYSKLPQTPDIQTHIVNILQSKMEKYVEIRDVSQFEAKSSPSMVTQIQEQLHGATHVLQKNLEKVINRGDQLDVLVEKSDLMSSSSAEFATRSKRLKRHMCWQKCKLTVLFLSVLLFLLVFIMMYFCGTSMSECITKSDSSAEP